MKTRRLRQDGLSRRALLRGAGAATVIAALPRPRSASATGAQPEPTWDCIVLGAGIAGVTAARDLERAGHRVLLVEGSDRIGGRMKSLRQFVKHPEFLRDQEHYPVEAGADFVHVGNRDRYPEFLAEIDQHFETEPFFKFVNNRMAFPLNWKCSQKSLLEALFFDPDLIATIGLMPGIERFADADDLPLGEYVARQGLEGNAVHLGRYAVSSHTPGVLYDPLVDLPIRGPNDRQAKDTISTAGFRADQLPAQLVDELSEWKLMTRPGGAEFAGFDALPHVIAAELEQPPLLGHRVLRVARDAEGVIVHTEHGQRQNSFRARSAVSTFSVGMLDQHPEIFGELLTADKRDVLRSVRIGPITKFCVEFQRRIWGSGRMSMMSNPTGAARTWFSEFPARAQGPHVLSGLLMSRDHEIIHGMTDEEALGVFLDEMQRVHAPNDKRWRPEDVLVGEGRGASFAPNIHREDWQRDPFALGGNSFIEYRNDVPTQVVAGLRRRLRDASRTLPLFWAGEATATAFDKRYQPLSVHGGYISGVRVAEDVDRYLAESPASFAQYYVEQLGPVPSIQVIAQQTVSLPLSRNLESAMERFGEAQLARPSVGIVAMQLALAGLQLHKEERRRRRSRGLYQEPKLAYRLPAVPAATDIRLSADVASEIEQIAARTSLTLPQATVALAKRALDKARTAHKTLTGSCPV